MELNVSNRKIILDTETTGLSPSTGHRVIEIACLEMIDKKLTGNYYHTYIQPQRLVDAGAFKVHGISNDFLADKPRFKDIYKEFLSFIGYSTIIAHNAQFDVGFLNHEINLVMSEMIPISLEYKIENFQPIICTKVMAQQLFGRGGNSLNDLCNRFKINIEHRNLHGALIDCELLFEVYTKLIEFGCNMNDEKPFEGMDELQK